MTTLRQIAHAMLLAPLALTIAACSDDADGEGGLSGEPIAPIDAPDGESWLDTTTVSEYDGYVLGNPEAPIKLVEYGSLTCPGCATFSLTGTEKLKSNYVASGRVSFELRNQIHGPHDLALATLVRCGGSPEAVIPRSDQVWANLETLLTPIVQNQQAVEQAISLPPDQRLVRIAEIGGFYDFFAGLGLGEDQARQCLADEESYTAIAERSSSQSEEFDVTGTPTFFINGRKVEVNSWAQLEPMLQKAGAR